MDSADAAVSAVLLRLTSPQVLGAVLALLLAGVIALLVARALRVRRAPGATAAQQRPHWLDHTLEGALILAPLVAALATLLAGRAALAAFATSTAVIDGALEIVGALVLLRFGVYLLGRMLGPGSWVEHPAEQVNAEEPHHVRFVGDRGGGAARLAGCARGRPQPRQPASGTNAVEPVGPAQGPGDRHRLPGRHEPDRARDRAPRHAARPAGRVDAGRSLQVRLLPVAGAGHAAGDQRRRR